jgi:hypothetical protein
MILPHIQDVYQESPASEVCGSTIERNKVYSKNHNRGSHEKDTIIHWIVIPDPAFAGTDRNTQSTGHVYL